MIYYHQRLFMPRVLKVRAAKGLAGGYVFGSDLYPVWLTSREWSYARRDLYSPAVTRDIQTGLFGRPLQASIPTDPPIDYRTFAYPAFTDLLLWPVSAVPFPFLRIAWVALLAGLTAVSIVFWTQALSWRVGWIGLGVISLLTLCSYPGLEGLYAGQLGLLGGFLLAASLLVLVRGRLLLAGFLMALTTVKPQMTLLAILYLFLWSTHDWRCRRRFSMSFFATIFVLMGASLAVWPHWIESWGRVILGYHGYATPPLTSELLGGRVGSYGGTVLIVLALIAALVLAWRGRAAPAGSDEFWLTLSRLLAITAITLLPGQAVYDHVILLPGIFWLASRKQLRYSGAIFRALFMIGNFVLLWPWAAALGLLVVRPFLRPEQFYSSAVFVLPLRTAAAFPFVVLGLLALAQSAMLRQAKLTSDLPAPQ
jgi:hypothetical protein